MARSLALLVAALVGVGASACGRLDSPEPDFDLLVRGGLVVDGTGSAARRADVGVRGGVVAAIGSLSQARSRREIDASGLVVAPGFVDAHSHADLILLADRDTQERLLSAKIRQGVTTIVVGNCGLGAAPATEPAAEVLAEVNGWMTPEGVRAPPLSVAEYLDRLASSGVVLNVATLVPHGPVRTSVMGLTAGAPSPEGLRAMKDAVGRGLDEGAFGVSAGLIYPPGMYADTEELVSLAREVADRGRVFAFHVRGSSETLVPATREIIEVARRSGARVHHSHLEAVGERFWSRIPQVLALEDAARAEGVRITHDVFPYTRAATMMSAVFPPWSLDGGVPALLDRLSEPDTRARIHREIDTRVPRWPPWPPGGWPHNLVGAVGWDGILVASVGEDGPEDLVGHSVADIARRRGLEPFEVVSELMLSQDGRVGQLVSRISGSDEDLEPLLAILRHPRAAVITDAEDYGRGSPHPAHAGAFPRVLRLARERELMDLEEAIRKMTGLPASILGISDRGVVREGVPADLVVLDPRAVTDRATWSEPRLPPDGIRWVVIGGRVAVHEGRYEGGVHGTVLRASS